MERIPYEVTVTAVSPIMLSSRPSSEGSSVYHTLEYIPGASLRGAWIEFYKQIHHITDEDKMTEIIFDRFMDQGYIFENFYPKNSLPLPLTAITCKQFPGFRSDDEEKCHGVKDSLLLYYENQRQFHMDHFQCTHVSPQGQVCGAPYTSYDKWVEFDGLTNIYKTTEPPAKIQTGHVAISSITQTIEKGKLFFEQAIDIDEKFTGVIHVPAHLCEEFEQLAEKAKTISLRVGGKKTSGYGEFRVFSFGKKESDIMMDAWDSLPLAERFRKFQAHCRELGIISEHEKAFSITLLSDAILLDPWYRFRTDLTPEFISYLTGISLPNTTLVHRHVAVRRLFGWNQQWHMALDEQIAVRRGSSYLYIAESDESDETWIDVLEKLEATWIGERTYEGYGQIFVCHPFHLETKEV
ncbi:RAMP superfamily CRISPR-associated protein [Geobacillus stearothermophilus]|nr:RAMP superfamily CRISPR-associated protein [Geobacillus stearothermophilus]